MHFWKNFFVMKANPRKMENNDPRFLHLYILLEHRLYISLPLEMLKPFSILSSSRRGIVA